MKLKTEFDPDKYNWHPSPLAGQIVLLITIDEDGHVDVAPKSWITMIAFKPPTIVIGCNRKHTTVSNLTKIPEFVVNIPSENLIRRIFDMPRIPSPRNLESLGLTRLPSLAVSPPGIEECYAHLECKLVKIEGIGKEYDVAIFGEVIKARINDDAQKGTNIDRYSGLRPAFFLEDGTYGVIDLARTLGKEHTSQSCAVVTLSDTGDTSEHISDHIIFLKHLQGEGKLIASGSFPDEESGGMYVLMVDSLLEADDIVKEDPLVARKVCNPMIRMWRRSF
jgi:flavin reductase (DIM6/NTAB) family NADH-FMN oxidoreductase RutF/uncharacterized protein YciI